MRVCHLSVVTLFCIGKLHVLTITFGLCCFISMVFIGSSSVFSTLLQVLPSFSHSLPRLVGLEREGWVCVCVCLCHLSVTVPYAPVLYWKFYIFSSPVCKHLSLKQFKTHYQQPFVQTLSTLYPSFIHPLPNLYPPFIQPLFSVDATVLRRLYGFHTLAKLSLRYYTSNQATRRPGDQRRCYSTTEALWIPHPS